MLCYMYAPGRQLRLGNHHGGMAARFRRGQEGAAVSGAAGYEELLDMMCIVHAAHVACSMFIVSIVAKKSCCRPAGRGIQAGRW